ncbi:putative trans-sialidase, partial [Trypanosoma cruzi]
MPNMLRHHFFSSVLLLIVVMMCCNAGGAAEAPEQPSEPKYKWKDIKDGEGEGVTVESLGVPGLVGMNGEVFAVAEAQCKKSDAHTFTGIASHTITTQTANTPEEVLNEVKGTQFLERGPSTSPKRMDVSRPTTVVEGNNIYMLVGKYSQAAAVGAQDSGAENWGLLLVQGNVSDGSRGEKRIQWKDATDIPRASFGDQLISWTGLIGGGGSGVKMEDGKLLFPVEGTKKGNKEGEAPNDEKAVSLLIYTSDAANWTLSKGMSDGGCSDPSVVGWKEDKLTMMTACADGRHRVYEIGDKGESWTEALGTLSRVWGNKQGVSGVRSGFITATILVDGEDDNRNVMLVTLPAYSEKLEKGGAQKGELHLWLTDNTHIVDIGPVSREGDDAAASSLLYKSGKSGEANNNEELIVLYEKKGAEGKPSPGVVSVLLTEQLQRVKDVLATWNKVDQSVSQLCPPSAEKDRPNENDCSGVKITDGLVGFLSGNFSGNTWRDEYLGVNATVNTNEGAAKATLHAGGVTFKGAWAEWPVGEQGENQLYHFANHNFTLVATVSIDKVPTREGPIPLMGVKMSDAENPVRLGLSYNNKKKWLLLCYGGENKELSITWQPGKKHQLAIVLQNGKQGSAYVDGKRVGGDEQCKLENTESKVISHFYIGGDGGSAEIQEGVFVTVTNVLLYNRPLSSTEIGALNPNKASIPSLVKEPTKPLTVSSASVVTPTPPVVATAQITETPSTP